MSSVYVDDQDKALRFYTEVLGFVKKAEFPVGEYRWLTVVSPDEPDGQRPGLDNGTLNQRSPAPPAGLRVMPGKQPAGR